MSAASTSTNDEQIAYWNSDAGERWASMQARIDTVFAPLTEPAMERAKLVAGEKVLDVGCGSGATTLEAARYVGRDGGVLGIDVSKPMLKLARRRATLGDFTQVELLEGDASVQVFQPTFDVLFSRFGWMFFADPVAALTNLKTALVPGGRLLFVTWQRLSKNPWFLAPVLAIREVVPVDPGEPKPDPLAPGPFAFSDPERIKQVLGAAGFRDVSVDPLETTMRLAGSGDINGAVEFSTRIGPGSRLIAEAPAEKHAAIDESIRRALAKHDGPGGVTLGGAVWIVSAKV